MTRFSAAQARVLGLDPEQHARVLGAPGSGKTLLLVESYAAVSAREGWDESELLVLAQNRLVATALRTQIERRISRALGGTPVRTASSFAFSVLDRVAALAGEAPPRLLTGTVEDEAVAWAVDERVASGTHSPRFAPEVMLSQAFRSELRELRRIVDDFSLDTEAFVAAVSERAAAGARDARGADLPPELVERWAEGVAILGAAAARLETERPGERSSSGLMRVACAAIAAGEVNAPRLVLVDDAQDLGEGPLALLAACADAGSAVWVFGDPDISTGAFQGERSRVLTSLSSELARRSRAKRTAPEPGEQLVVLDRVYRHGADIRTLVRGLTERIGAGGGAPHRAAEPAELAAPGAPEVAHSASGAPDPADSAEPGAPGAPALPDPPHEAVQFAVASSPSEQLGMIAHRMRARRLGLDGRAPLGWGEMAVVCRSRGEAVRIARALAGQQVPTGIAAGGVVLREHQVVRELIRLLEHALGISPLDAQGVLGLAGGVLGGLDPVAVRRLRGGLLIEERRAARAEQREASPVEEIVLDAFAHPEGAPVIDSAGGRAIRRLGRMAAAGAAVHAHDGTPRETLWAIWDGAKLAERWQRTALGERGAAAEEANRSLDAVMGLFFALQRHEEQDSEQPIAELLDELATNTVPEDSLAGRGASERVTVTTPQGLIGREFPLVAVIGLQDGSWPNLRARGSLFGTAALERWLRGGEALQPARRDTVHDELRLFAHSAARASGELLVVAVADDEQHPSAFFTLGAAQLQPPRPLAVLPSSRLTLRGATAAMRRRVVEDPSDSEAVRSLIALAAAGAPGAHPDEWYGVIQPSSETPLFAGSERATPVSPSQLERVETCALDWAIGALGGGSGSVQASLGTLIHHALETVDGSDPEAMLEAIAGEWGKLPFDAEWEAERARRTAAAMAAGLSDYLWEFSASDRELLGRESSFSLELGDAELRGTADRIERRVLPDGAEITVVDLKTGRTPVSKPAAEAHVQLQAYQLGVARDAFAGVDAQAQAQEAGPPPRTTAKLLYVHPDATRGAAYVERSQSGLTPEAEEALLERIASAAQTMRAGEFTARVEHHCTDPHAPGECRLHIIQAVSHA